MGGAMRLVGVVRPSPGSTYSPIEETIGGAMKLVGVVRARLRFKGDGTICNHFTYCQLLSIGDETMSGAVTLVGKVKPSPRFKEMALFVNITASVNHITSVKTPWAGP